MAYIILGSCYKLVFAYFPEMLLVQHLRLLVIVELPPAECYQL